MIHCCDQMVAFQKTVHSTGNFLGKTNSPNITVVDTPGFKVTLWSLMFLSESLSCQIFSLFVFVFNILIGTGPTGHRICGGAYECSWRRGLKAKQSKCSWLLFISRLIITQVNHVLFRSKRSRVLWLFTSTRTGSPAPLQGHWGSSLKCLVSGSYIISHCEMSINGDSGIVWKNWKTSLSIFVEYG